MREPNRFQHQSYPTTPVLPPVFDTLNVTDGDRTDFSRLHAEFGVSHVVLVHGTFMGDDSFAISETLNAIADSAPVLKKPLQNLARKLKYKLQSFTAELTQDVGNYDDRYSDRFQKLVGDDPIVKLMQPTWSGQNHHLARADLAVRLFCLLSELDVPADQSILLWGHSHAGNGFALLTNLIANERKSVEQFFAAANQDAPHWKQAQELLAMAPSPHPLAHSLRIVEFGTPVRYGWDSGGCRDLIHVLHHRNNDPEDSITTKPLFPPHSVSDVAAAKFGDWVQAFGITGTDVAPPTSSTANKRMAAVLEAGLEEPDHGIDTKFLPSDRVRNLCARWKAGTRCHDQGLNVLVEYEPCGRNTALGLPIEESLFGHGVATTLDWLPTHLDLVMQHLSANRQD